MGCVYLVTNLDNGRRYVGFTSQSLEKRKAEHLKAASQGSRTYFHRALRKCGEDGFYWKELFRSPNEEILKLREVGYIVSLKTKAPNGYNLTDGGDGLIGCSEEVKKKIGDAHRGRKRPPRTSEYREKLSAARRNLLDGKDGEAFREKLRERRLLTFAGPKGDDLRERIGRGNRGKPKSEEQKAKLREARARFLESEAGKEYRLYLRSLYLGRRLSEETKRRMSLSRTKHAPSEVGVQEVGG